MMTNPLILNLNSPDWWTRIHAEVTLREQGTGALGDLTHLLNDPAQPTDARWRAAHALGMIADRGALDALTQALRDPSSDIQYFAAWSLGRIGDLSSFDALQSVLNSTKLEEQANYAAAMSMVQIDRQRGLAILRQTLSSENEAARRVAMGALASLHAD